MWDVVRVPFPYTNQSVHQHRPALVVGRQNAPGSPDLLWVLMIASAQHRRWTGDVEISDLAAAGLPAASIVRTAKIATIVASAAERKGALPPQDRAAISASLAAILR